MTSAQENAVLAIEVLGDGGCCPKWPGLVVSGGAQSSCQLGATPAGS